MLSRNSGGSEYTFKVESIAPGHCTGEPTFAALKKIFGDHIFMQVSHYSPAWSEHGLRHATGRGPALQQDDLTSYRRLARRESVRNPICAKLTHNFTVVRYGLTSS
jgi:7,8-dihydropterin-6-yl-methyl-4-(beta-D-ribofuranosyl)aminobenzene 5'-phosphate synthase